MLVPEMHRDSRGGWNRHKIQNFTYLTRELRAGRHPEDLGCRVIGQGAQNVAYGWTDSSGAKWVIKKFVGGYRDESTRPPRIIQKYGARMARTIRCKTWVVQERAVEVLAHTDRQEYPQAWASYDAIHELDVADIHLMNCGVDTNGQLIVFDW